ncbi:MAG: serine/threonine-protein kinase [Planctomycetota bacterium]
MPEPSQSLDELVFEYLEACERSEDEAAACLARLKGSSSDGGVALESAIRRLAETGLLEVDPDANLRIGRYTIVRRLARGGMGEVFLARSEDGGDEVAIKLLRRELEDDEDARRRFAREVEIVRRLRHPGIAALLEVGEDRGLAYLVFERIEGVTLEAAVRAANESAGEDRTARDFALSFDGDAADGDLFEGDWMRATARVGREIARALGHAHAQGVIHRDVKPSNVMITPTGRVVLLDFGLASLREADSMTQSGQRLGSLPYMAPETVRGASDASPATDVYSLGVTLFELATLRSPFEARDPERLAVEILVGAPRTARRVDARVPAELDRVIACAMDASPAHRYGSSEALAADLTEFLEGRTVRARSASWPRTIGRWSRRHPARAAALIATAFLVIAGPIGYALVERRYADELEGVNAALSASLEQEIALKEAANLAADEAMQAIYDQLRWFASQGLRDVPGGMEVRAVLVESGLDILDRLPEGAGSRESREWLRGSLLAARGQVRAASGDRAGAQADYREQERILRSLLAASPDEARLTYELGALVGERGNRLAGDARPAEAIALLAEADELLRRAHTLGWEGSRAAATLLQVRGVHANALVELGEHDAALELCDLAEDEFEPFGGSLDPVVEQRLRAVEWFGLSELAGARARVWRDLGEPDAADDEERRRLELVAEVLVHVPTHRAARSRAAAAHRQLAVAAMARGEVAVGLHHLDVAVDGLRALAADFPGHVEPQRGLAVALQSRAAAGLEVPSTDAPQLEAAERAASEAIDMIESQGGTSPMGWMPFYVRSALRSRMGDVAGARDDLDRLVDAAGGNADADAACLRYRADAWSEIYGALDRDGATAGTRDEAREQVLALLEAAVEAGYDDLDELETTRSLDPLRDHPRFVALIGRVER